jgi:hypothetical protein
MCILLQYGVWIALTMYNRMTRLTQACITPGLRSTNLTALEAQMYLFFAPATLALAAISFITLKEQFGSLS